MIATANSSKTLQPSYHRNQQYSIVGLTNAAGTLVERYTYSAYGTLGIYAANGTVRSSSTYNNRYTYTGREYDPDLKLYHFRARWYDPATGGFVSRDPMGYVDGMSLYRGYFGVDETDPDGTYSYAIPGIAPTAGAVTGVIGWVVGHVSGVGTAVVGAAGAVTTTVIVTTAVVVTATVIIARHIATCTAVFRQCLTNAVEAAEYCAIEWEPNQGVTLDRYVICRNGHMANNYGVCLAAFWRCIKYQSYKILDADDFSCYECGEGDDFDPCNKYPTIDFGRYFDNPPIGRSKRRPVPTWTPSNPV